MAAIPEQLGDFGAPKQKKPVTTTLRIFRILDGRDIVVCAFTWRIVVRHIKSMSRKAVESKINDHTKEESPPISISHQVSLLLCFVRSYFFDSML